MLETGFVFELSFAGFPGIFCGVHMRSSPITLHSPGVGQVIEKFGKTERVSLSQFPARGDR